MSNSNQSNESQEKPSVRPTLGSYYLHVDGGVYLVTGFGYLTSTGENAVIYAHQWPFEMKSWIRPISEWTAERFQRICQTEMREIMDEDRGRAQIRVSKARTERKARE